ncbi:hypothetical protein LEN26_013775 [Aphanomyces euteiches]|nr:hypothetical protein LEN26_013775 [Aphanomyces euteiches]
MSAHQETKPTKSAHTSKFGRRAIDAAAEDTSRSQSLPVQVDSSVQLESRSFAPVSRRSGDLGSVLSGMRPPPVVPGYSAKGDSYDRSSRRRPEKKQAPATSDEVQPHLVVFPPAPPYLPSPASSASSCDEWVYDRNDLYQPAIELTEREAELFGSPSSDTPGHEFEYRPNRIEARVFDPEVDHPNGFATSLHTLRKERVLLPPAPAPPLFHIKEELVASSAVTSSAPVEASSEDSEFTTSWEDEPDVEEDEAEASILAERFWRADVEASLTTATVDGVVLPRYLPRVGSASAPSSSAVTVASGESGLLREEEDSKAEESDSGTLDLGESDGDIRDSSKTLPTVMNADPQPIMRGDLMASWERSLPDSDSLRPAAQEMVLAQRTLLQAATELHERVAEGFDQDVVRKKLRVFQQASVALSGSVVSFSANVSLEVERLSGRLEASEKENVSLASRLTELEAQFSAVEASRVQHDQEILEKIDTINDLLGQIGTPASSAAAAPGEVSPTHEDRLRKLEETARAWPQIAAKMNDRLGQLEQSSSVIPSSALPPAVPSATLEREVQNEVVSGSATASPAAGGEDNLPSEPESEEDPSGSSQVESLPVQASNASEQPSALSGGDWDFYSRMLGISAEELKAAKDLDFEPSAKYPNRARCGFVGTSRVACLNPLGSCGKHKAEELLPEELERERRRQVANGIFLLLVPVTRRTAAIKRERRAARKTAAADGGKGSSKKSKK